MLERLPHWAYTGEQRGLLRDPTLKNVRDGRLSSRLKRIRRGGYVLHRACRRFAVALVFAVGVLLVAVAPAQAGTVLRGICEPSLLDTWRFDGPAAVEEFSDRLGADVVRVNLIWSWAEPSPGVYDEDYMGRVVGAVREIRSHGMQVLIVVFEAPRWASDRALWATALPGDRTGVYHTYYPPALDSLDELQVFMEQLSAGLQGEVLAYACWNEPNFWMYFYPQQTSSDAAFAARRYTRMLAAFSRGVRAGDPQAKVVAGETAPFGNNTTLRTSPQRFARQLARAGAGEYFDAYSHHPYAFGGNADIAPAALPRDPQHTVWLANIDALLDIFPGKPLYLTEFGYATAPNRVFGLWVSRARQASYLKAAFRVASRQTGVEMLVWFPRRDSSDSGTYSSPWGNYCGLVTLRGQPKRAYFAFAGGNELTLSDPGGVARGGSLVLRGVLTSARMGPLADKALAVLARRPGRSWVMVTTATTRSDGSYVVRLRPYASATWKVRWSGVVTSPRRWVPVD